MTAKHFQGILELTVVVVAPQDDAQQSVKVVVERQLPLPSDAATACDGDAMEENPPCSHAFHFVARVAARRGVALVSETLLLVTEREGERRWYGLVMIVSSCQETRRIHSFSRRTCRSCNKEGVDGRRTDTEIYHTLCKLTLMSQDGFKITKGDENEYPLRVLQ